jgi:F0F1-type ATP synthase assembly protein I
MVFQVALIVGCLMIGSVVLGLAADAHFGTRPLFTLLLALLSLPLSIWLTYRIAMKTVARARRAYEAYLASKRATNSDSRAPHNEQADLLAPALGSDQ